MWVAFKIKQKILILHKLMQFSFSDIDLMHFDAIFSFCFGFPHSLCIQECNQIATVLGLPDTIPEVECLTCTVAILEELPVKCI